MVKIGRNIWIKKSKSIFINWILKKETLQSKKRKKRRRKKKKKESKGNVDNVYQSALDREFFASPHKSTLNVRPFVIFDDILNFLPPVEEMLVEQLSAFFLREIILSLSLPLRYRFLFGQKRRKLTLEERSNNHFILCPELPCRGYT